MRNFRLLKASEEGVNLATNIFNPTFISRLSPFKALRFMDWGSTNGSPLVSWSSRNIPTSRTYGNSAGVPYEMMIALGNKTQKDVWVCVPHQADDNFITQMATLFKDNLNSNLTIYLEYSNEVWNWQFEQAQYNNNTKPANLSYGQAYSERSKHIFQLWYGVFAGQTQRVKRVLGLQGGFNSLNQEIMAQIPQSEWDMASPSYYFGLDHGATGNPVLTGASTGADINTNARNAYFNSWLPTLKQDYRNVKVFGKQIVSYEGGQHYTNFQTVPYQQAMYDAQYLSSMYNLYNDVLDTIRNMGNKLAMSFVLSGVQESIYGSWGHLPNMYLSQPYMSVAPKYQAILDNSCLPFQETQPLILPVDLVFFNAKRQDRNDVLINWRTANEQNVANYELERSNNALDFTSIYQKDIFKNTTQTVDYQYFDKNLPQGIYYYRLKTNDTDKRFQYSKIITVSINEGNTITLFPNPTTGFLTIETNNYDQPFELINVVGQVVLTGKTLTKNLDLRQFVRGVYYLKVFGIPLKIVKE